jgi:predicted AAA+ superfamily ATPase
MKRIETEELIRWKGSNSRKPLIIRGARQVGKTWLVKDFARQQYQQTAYINFESSPNLKGLFADNYDIRRILTAIQIETGINIDPANTIIILDEIQEAAGGLTALKYFQENASEYHVIAAGSLLGVALGGNSSFPVGKVEFLDLHPLGFTEFLEAVGEGRLTELLRSRDWSLITSFKTRYQELLRQYYYVGGMPEAVLSFSQKKNFQEVRRIQQAILTSYEQDFSKHPPTAIVPRIRMLWNSIPSQLAKENRKFVYGLIRSGARAKEYEQAMAWLIDCGLIHKVHNVSKPGIPLKAYEELNAFKLFSVDVGLLAAMTALDAKTLIEGNEIFTEFKGSLTEQYVLQQLLQQKPDAIFYWAPENARAEIDFLIQASGQVIPIEVKGEENLKAKSLAVYREKFNPIISIRTSMSDYRKEKSLINLPLYAIGEFLSVINE